VAVKPGDILESRSARGRYRIDALIGRGGMGHVFAATELDSQEGVAIKVVSRVLVDETLMARLHREAEAASRIRSDYVPRVLEVSDTDDLEMYLVMERLVGEPLSQRMRDRGALPWNEVVQIGEDVLRGLIDAHTAGVVHRDIKPSNVFLAMKGGRYRAMVLDFGVCKTDTVDTERLTGTGESIGTVAYMAPEQIRGASKVDDRADLYAFGVLVFELVCARLPHDGPSQMAILASKLENAPARLRDCSRTPVPEGLDALVHKALARDPKQRFASAQELLKAWRKLGGAPLVASLPPPASTESGGGPPSFHDPHDAPTTVSLGEHEATAHGRIDSIPLEAHPTQTALTAGISLRKSGSGRVAVVLAACGLVAGVIGVIAFFARGPDVAAAPASASPLPAESAFAAPSLPSDPPLGASAAAVEGAPSFELADTPPEAVSTPLSAKSEPRKTTSRPRPSRTAPATPAAAPKASGPHITAQPRY